MDASQQMQNVCVCAAGGAMCLQQVASNTIKVLNAPDTPHFTFDAVLDMSVQQEGVFAGQHQLMPCTSSMKHMRASLCDLVM